MGAASDANTFRLLLLVLALHASRHITFVKTADVGFGVFLCDTATGRKLNVRVPTGEHDLDYPFFRVWPLLKVWPWSPDDSSFAYSDNEWLFICNGQTGQSTARFDLPLPVTALIWLNPASIRFMEGDGKLHQLDRQADGTWRSQAVAIGEFELRRLRTWLGAYAALLQPWLAKKGKAEHPFVQIALANSDPARIGATVLVRSLKISCTACGGHVEFPTNILGEKIPCPHCAKTVTLSNPD